MSESCPDHKEKEHCVVPTSPISTITSSSVSDIDKSVANDERIWKASDQVKKTTACQAFVLFVVSIDSTILTTTLPTVADALGADSVESFWIAASFLLASAASQPVVASLADIFNRLPVFLSSVLLFTVGSILCSVSNNVEQMLAGRTIQGIGGGGIMSMNLVILSDQIPLRERPKYQGLIQLVFGLGTCLAPTLGGALNQISWRWLFFINLPFCGVALIAVPLYVRNNPAVTPSKASLRSADWFGMTAIVGSTTSLLIGIAWGGTKYPWSSPNTLIPIAAGSMGIVATVLYEAHIAGRPFLRVALFRSRSAIIGYVGTVLQGMMLFAESYFVPMYMLTCKLYTPTLAGVAMLPFCLAVVPISGIAGALISRSGSYRWALWLGWILNTVGLATLSLLQTTTPTAIWASILVCAGTGQGLLLMGNAILVQTSAKREDAAHAVGMYSFLRTFGFCLGVVVGGVILHNFLEQKMVDVGLPIGSGTVTEATITKMRSMGETDARVKSQYALAWALQRLWIILAPFSGLAGLLSTLGMRHKSLDH